MELLISQNLPAHDSAHNFILYTKWTKDHVSISNSLFWIIDTDKIYLFQ